MISHSVSSSCLDTRRSSRGVSKKRRHVALRIDKRGKDGARGEIDARGRRRGSIQFGMFLRY